MAFRRPNRQIEVFDISLMAVVTKAMGAFLVLMLLLLPYYRSSPAYRAPAQDLSRQLKDLQEQLEKMRRNLGPGGTDPAQLQSQLDTARQQLASAEDSLGKLSKQLDMAWSQLRQAQDENRRLGENNAALQQQNDALSNSLGASQAQRAAAESRAQQFNNEAADLGNTLKDAEPSPKLLVSVIFTVDDACKNAITVGYDFDMLNEDAPKLSKNLADRVPDFVDRVGTSFTSVGSDFRFPGQPTTNTALYHEFLIRSDRVERRYFLYVNRQPDQHVPTGCTVSLSVNNLAGTPPLQATSTPLPIPDLDRSLLCVIDFKRDPPKVVLPSPEDIKLLDAILTKRKEIEKERAEKLQARQKSSAFVPPQ